MRNFVGSHFLLAVLLYVSNMSKGNSQLDETCPKSGDSCIKNETIMFVDPGSDVIIRCICSTETKGGVTGPVISSSIDTENSDHFPYTDGSVLNSKLDTAKYMVDVNSNKNECNLKIVKFSREEDGIYKCQYQIMDKIAIHVYTIAIKNPPKVIVKYTLEHDYIKFECNAYGEPKNYTFLPWEHQSKYHEHIRYLNGNRNGTLCVQRTKNLPQKQFEDNGYYICRLSNGIPVAGRNKTQEGKVDIILKVPPVFLLENRYIQYGAYGSQLKLWVEIYSDTKVLSKHIKRYEAKQNIEAHIQEQNVTGHVLSHRVRVTVLGTRLTFKVYMEREEDFNNYTIIVCNIGGCTNMTIEVRSSTVKTSPGSYYVFNPIIPIIAVTILSFIAVSFALKIYFRKRKTSRNLSDGSVEDINGPAIENHLYQSVEHVELVNLRRPSQAEFSPMESISDFQISNDDRNLDPPANNDNTAENRRVLLEGAHALSNESNLNYVEVVFDTSTEETVIHGLEEKLIYSDIDHLAKAVALPSSSESENEDDFVFVEGIQNFSRKTNVKQ